MFFNFRQNNSGGFFHKPAVNVIVEADEFERAKEIACEEFDLYFDGVSRGLDCGCCGDRWSDWNDDGSQEPDWSPSFCNESIPQAVIRYANGNIKFHF